MDEKTISMPEFANALLATQQPGYVAENLNEACNRRAQLALATVVAAIRSRRYAIEAEVPENEAQKVSAFAKLVLIEDLLDDLIAIRKETNLRPQADESHGICARHKEQEMADFLKWKALNAVEEAMSLPRRDENAR